MMDGLLFSWGIIYVIVTVFFSIIRQYDEGCWNRTSKDNRIVWIGCGANSFVISRVAEYCEIGGAERILLCVVAGCLLFACMTDSKTCEVFQFTWWPAAMAGVALWLSRGSVEWKMAVSLLCYAVLQELFFGRYYGRADCHGFVLCALVGTRFEWDMVDYLLHMLAAFAGLALVQVARHNIARNGNLKRPVAFLPYITFSFWVLLFFEKSVILKRISETNL